jgi:hypothetical protein
MVVDKVKVALEAYEKSNENAAAEDVAILIESLRILGLKTEHATLRERLDSYQKKQ